MKLRLSLITFLAAATTGVFAQMGAAPAASASAPATALSLPAEAKMAYTRVRDNIVKAVDKMPDDAYDFKPLPDVRTFAQVVNHVTAAQMRTCSGINGQMKSPPAPGKTKAEIVAAVKASFDECDKAYDAVTLSNMADMMDMGPFHRSKLGLLWGNVSHDNEQYATLALYMRLKGIMPPSFEGPPAPPK